MTNVKLMTDLELLSAATKNQENIGLIRIINAEILRRQKKHVITPITRYKKQSE